jgi:hypothetical protein
VFGFYNRQASVYSAVRTGTLKRIKLNRYLFSSHDNAVGMETRCILDGRSVVATCAVGTADLCLFQNVQADFGARQEPYPMYELSCLIRIKR